jgi:hypothetical protein
MPPHCDSLDGPVVTAARRALDAGDVELILPYVHADGEVEMREAFDRAAKVRSADMTFGPGMPGSARRTLAS